MKTQYWLLIVAVLLGGIWYFYDSARIAQAAQQVVLAKQAQQAAEKAADAARAAAAQAQHDADEKIAKLQSENQDKQKQIATLKAAQAAISQSAEAEKATVRSLGAADVAAQTRQLLGLPETEIKADGDDVLFTLAAARQNAQSLVDLSAQRKIVVNQNDQIVNLQGQVLNLSEMAKQAAAEMSKERDYWTAATKYQETQIATAEASLREERAKKWRSRLRWGAAGGAAVAILMSVFGKN